MTRLVYFFQFPNFSYLKNLTGLGGDDKILKLAPFTFYFCFLFFNFNFFNFCFFIFIILKLIFFIKIKIL